MDAWAQIEYLNLSRIFKFHLPVIYPYSVHSIAKFNFYFKPYKYCINFTIQKNLIMEITVQKKAQSFRLPVDLIEKLKRMAKRENRSLNNFVECALLELAYNEPNEETLASIREAKEGKLEGPLDVSSVEAMYKSMGL